MKERMTQDTHTKLMHFIIYRGLFQALLELNTAEVTNDN